MISADRDPLSRLAIAPRWITVAVGRAQPLSALGYHTVPDGLPSSMQDYTRRVAWITDDPAVATVGADGLLRGVSAGTTTVLIAGAGRSATAAVRVLPQRSAPATADVVSLRIDTLHTGAATAAPVNASTVFPSSPLWTVALRGSLSYPLIGDGKVFVLATDRAPAGDQRLWLHAFDARTGSDAWGGAAALTTFSRAGQMALEGQRLVAITSDCDLTAFDTRSGARLWSVNLSDRLDNVWSCTSPPTVRNGIVYVSGAGVAVTAAALDLATGEFLWSRFLALSGGAPMTVTDDAAYLSSRLQGVKLDAQSGVVLWRHSGPGSGGGSSVAALFEGRLYMDEPTQDESIVLDAGSGAIVSRFDSALAPAFETATFSSRPTPA